MCNSLNNHFVETFKKIEESLAENIKSDKKVFNKIWSIIKFFKNLLKSKEQTLSYVQSSKQSFVETFKKIEESLTKNIESDKKDLEFIKEIRNEKQTQQTRKKIISNNSSLQKKK